MRDSPTDELGDPDGLGDPWLVKVDAVEILFRQQALFHHAIERCARRRVGPIGGGPETLMKFPGAQWSGGPEELHDRELRFGQVR